MPLTPVMLNTCAVLEQMIRPSLTAQIRESYAERAEGREPTEIRAREIVDRCFEEMRRAIEEAFDLRKDSDEARKLSHNAIYKRLQQELDLELPQLVIQ